MPRSRTLRPGFFTSFKLAQVSRDARLCFQGLWVEADDEGRLIDSPKALAGAIFPHDDDVTPKKMKTWIDALEQLGVIERYEANGGRYLFVTNWTEHQKPPHPTPSKLPPPPSHPHENSVNGSRETSEDITENAALGLGFRSQSLSPVSCSLSQGHCTETVEGETVAQQPGDQPQTAFAIVNRLIKLCQGHDRKRVAAEASAVVKWAAPHVDLRIIEESLGWYEEQAKPPDLPRAVAKVIRDKAGDRGIGLAIFEPAP